MDSSNLRQRLHTPPSAKLAAQDEVLSAKGVTGSSLMTTDDIIKYGEFCQLTMDAVDLNQWSRYRGQIKYSEAALLDDSDGHLSLVSAFQCLPKVCPPAVKDGGYKAEAYLYASEDTTVAKAIKRKGKPIPDGPGICIGYIAYSAAAKDIVVAWRGTSQVYEWLQDAEVEQTKYEPDPPPPAAGKQAPQPVPYSKKDILPPRVAKPLLALVAGAGAVVYGGIPALPVFALGSIIFGLANSEELFAFLFTALYAASASLPIYRLLVPQFFPTFPDWFARLQIPFLSRLGLPPAGNFAAVYTLIIGFLSLLLNSFAVIPAHFPFKLLEGSYWGVNALLVGLFALLPMGLTAGEAAYAAAGEGPFVHEGFCDFYGNMGQDGKLPQKSSREVLFEQVAKLIARHETDHGRGDRNLTITMTGHSLGGAMAALSAFDVADSDRNVYWDGSRVSVRAVTFEAPRVGNPAFVQRFADHRAHLKIVRVANKPDVVPDVPKAFFLQNVYFLVSTLLNWQWGRDAINEIEKLEYKTKLPSAYEHAKCEPGDEHDQLDSRTVKYLKRMGSALDLIGNSARFSTYHNLELNLYMLSESETGVFTRDVALVNKTYDNLDPRVGIAPNWLETLSPDVKKARSATPAAMIEPYNSVDESNEARCPEEKRQIGYWNSDEEPDQKPLTKTVPDFDAAETKAEVQLKKSGSR